VEPGATRQLENAHRIPKREGNAIRANSLYFPRRPTMLYMMLPWIIWAGMADIFNEQFESRVAERVKIDR